MAAEKIFFFMFNWSMNIPGHVYLHELIAQAQKEVYTYFAYRVKKKHVDNCLVLDKLSAG
jgi:hypothetical protein